MTVRELIDAVAAHPGPLAAALLLPPVLVLALRFIRGREHPDSSWRYLYSVLVFVVCIPGVLATLLTLYALFFTGQNLLDVNLVVYLLPIASMVATLALIAQNVRFADVPGFDRLSGLLLLLAATFVLTFVLSRTRIWIVFGGSLTSLILLAAVLYGVLALGTRRLFGRQSA